MADQSLPADEYIKLGMPAYDREWAGHDMATAASKLDALSKSAPEQLPRFGSDRSGAVFERIVARDNLGIFRSRSLPIAARFPEAMQYGESLNVITKLYMNAVLAGKAPAEELIELMGATLRVAQVQLELLDEFLPTLSKDDPRYSVRMGGLEKVRRGLAMVVSGSILAGSDDRSCGTAARARLLTYWRETFPAIVPKLSAPSRAEVLQRLGEIVDEASFRELRPQLILLRDEVRAAVKASGRP